MRKLSSKTFSLNAQKARLLLIALVVLLIGGSIGGFYSGKAWLLEYAKRTNASLAEADSGEASVSKLRQLEVLLANYSEQAQEARSIVVENKKYEYQDQILTLDKYARESGVHITNIDYTAGLPGSAASGSQPTPQTTPKTATSKGGLQTKTLSITLAQPVNYNNLLLFIRKIEQSPVRMQIASVGVVADAITNGVQVNPQAFTIDIYIR